MTQWEWLNKNGPDWYRKRQEVQMTARNFETEKAAEHRVPPHPAGVIELLRRAGHTVVVREKPRNTGLAYRLDNERERNALQLTNRARKLGIL